MPLAVGAVRPLPPVAARVDAALARMDAEVDWLTALSPIHNDALWEAFEESGRSRVPPFSYAADYDDLSALRARLLALPVDDIESPLLHGLLSEKQRELDRQIELVRLRDTDGFVAASLDLFGGAEPRLLRMAREILERVPAGPPPDADAGLDEMLAAAEAELAWYRARAPGFRAEIVVEDDLNSMLMVSQGNLHVAAGIRLPQARVQPLVQHEIGTHVVTRHNGRQQPLRQLESGLADYDPLQEGLAVLAEYVSGWLPPGRLRILAARVIATDMAVRGEDVPAIFERLHHGHDLPAGDAFDVAVRARRGGGLTKDAVYLRGLADLLDHLHEGGDIAPLFMGKFALSHLVVLERLVEEGWARPPAVLPRWLDTPVAAARLERCRTLSVVDLHQDTPQ
ncbi:flavohemoglobin expression-modulating QEGLA motif protein [Coralloluteibacterium thermophilus]|uniref:Flavohemoglobin expression-modulating QEGLA motif protein n=1 Tax=Coralloluteibacterium thermophilum TaxID=2707049 RepID=A0ABV9NHE7_9GAMM